MPKQMRKGTRSCRPCRRRKVRCWYSSPEASVCVHCARRKAACVPQGGVQHDPVRDSVLPQDVTATDSEGLVALFMAVRQLRRRVQASLPASLPSQTDIMSSFSEVLSYPEMVQSDCAPVIKLLNHRLIGRRTEPGHDLPAQWDVNRKRSSHSEKHGEPLPHVKHPLVLYEMCAALPTDPDIAEIITTRSQWWGTWRQSFGLAWGEEEDCTLTQFATRAVREANPSLLGSLLLCFALSTGDYTRYLVPLERCMIAETLHTTHEYDLQFLMGLGLCLLSALRPRRAWMVYRKANGLMQLAGIHRAQQRSECLDSIFWQLFGADRWVSLLIGLPYSIPDHLCYLPIPAIDQSDPVTFHHRHMILLISRVIDCLQSAMGLSFTAVVSVDEEIDKVSAQLPPNYLNVPHISACPNEDEKSVRFYRLAEVSQLKTFLYLPLFLKQCDLRKQKLAHSQSARYGRNVCLSSARSLLEAYLALYDMDPTTAVVDNSIKLSSFTALAAAVILFLDFLAGGHSSPVPISNTSESSTLEFDTTLINRTVTVFDACSEGEPRSLCGQCHTALVDLISCSQMLGRGESRSIAVPYFGVVEITRTEDNDATSHSLEDPSNDGVIRNTSMIEDPASTSLAPDNRVFPTLTVADDTSFSYHGLWQSYLQESLWAGQFLEADHDPINVEFGPYLAAESSL